MVGWHPVGKVFKLHWVIGTERKEALPKNGGTKCSSQPETWGNIAYRIKEYYTEFYMAWYCRI